MSRCHPISIGDATAADDVLNSIHFPKVREMVRQDGSQWIDGFGTGGARSLGDAMLNGIHDGGENATDLPGIDPDIVDSKRLQMFYVAAKEGTFATAARLLGVSPSAVSHAIKALEEDLGCSLFRRSGPQVKPTRAGIRLLPMVGELLVRMSSMKNVLAALEGRTERLVFTIPGALQGILGIGVLSSFRECFPAATLEVVNREDGLEPACGMGVDFEIGYVDRMPVDLVRRDLMREELRAFVAPFHILGQKGRITPGDLRKFLVIFPDRHAYELILRQVPRGGDREAPAWILSGASVARDFALQGQGIAFLPEWAVGPLVREGGLVELKLQDFGLRRTCCAWWSPSQPLTWIAEVFLNLLSAETERGIEIFRGADGSC